MKTATPELTLMQIDPRTLGVRDQARADATPDDELVASIKRHGIMQPPTVMLDADIDQYVILVGHRRVGGAIAAGLDEITVIVRPGDDADEVLKLEQQIIENERRKALSARELAQGFKKLELFGKTPADIARELGEKPERVKAGLKITASAAAAQLVDEDPSIDFEQAAIIAEFEDHPKLQQKLIETATTNPANFKRDVETQRTQREVDARINTLKAQLDADDVPLADVVSYETAGYWSGKGAGPGKGRTLDRLGIRPEEHLDCPGHAAVIHKAQAYHLAAKPSTWLMYVCTDWEGNGHAQTTVTEKTAEQLAQEAEFERERAERRARQELVNANTRARRTWLHGYLNTGRLRPTAAHFDLMADALALQIHGRQPAPAHITLELLGGEPVEQRWWHQTDSNDSALIALIAQAATPNLRIIIANALATFEHAIDEPEVIPYLEALAEFGYELTDTDREHIAAAEELLAEEEALGGPEYDTDNENGDDE
jgi:ParB/RepB/Spo0J family partition protein